MSRTIVLTSEHLRVLVQAIAMDIIGVDDPLGQNLNAPLSANATLKRFVVANATTCKLIYVSFDDQLLDVILEYPGGEEVVDLILAAANSNRLDIESIIEVKMPLPDILVLTFGGSSGNGNVN